MEQQKIRPKNKNRKPLYLILLILLGFILFFVFLMRPSLQNIASKEVQACSNKSDVKLVWDKYKAELQQDDDFCQTVRDKLQ
jgi:Skp family chaperone for outer membrane proteins